MSEVINVSDREATQEALENSIKLETFEQTGILKDLLNKDGFDSCCDSAVLVHHGYMDMCVSHRYMCGGWSEVLHMKAIRNRCGEYTTISE